MKKVAIWIKVGDHEPTRLETCRNEEAALLRVRRYEREDRNELAEGYGFPYGLPKYFIIEANK